MTKRDFFMVMLKLFGIYGIIQVIVGGVPFGIVSILFGNTLFSMGGFGDTLSMIIPFVVLLWLMYLLVIRPESIVKFLRLNKGFEDDRMEFGDLTQFNLLNVGVVIVGGLMLVENLTGLLSQSYFAFEEQIGGVDFAIYDRFHLKIFVERALNVAIGYLILSNSNSIANRLMPKEN